jgi:hypothetical protein
MFKFTKSSASLALSLPALAASAKEATSNANMVSQLGHL